MVVARRSVDLSARSSGRIDHIDAGLGRVVHAQEELVTLDARSLRGELAVAQAQHASAAADERRLLLLLAQTKAQADRMHAAPANAVVPADLEKADYAVQIASAQLEVGKAVVAERQARIEQLRAQLDDTTLRAPFAGTIAAHYLDSGTTVATGVPILRLISATDLVVRFAVSESLARSMFPRQRVQIESESGGGQPVSAEAVVERIAPEIDAASRLVTVEASMVTGPNPDAPSTLAWRSGSQVRVLLRKAEQP